MDLWYRDRWDNLPNSSEDLNEMHFHMCLSAELTNSQSNELMKQASNDLTMARMCQEITQELKKMILTI
ncbi:hypothetical protein M0804_008985 [Polistes exclamans]|nr:hypothetical protein M0804_008985 [Polistes exclamans]